MKAIVTEQYQTACVDTLKKWVAVPSVLDETDSQAPFGSKIQKCLELALATCQELGFHTYLDPDGYYGYAEIGSGDELVAVLCHLDVVPADNPAEWTYPPFDATLVDNWLYGRGTQDDKGPTVAALYAVKALMDDPTLEFTKRVRFIFGTDEETLWRCMQRYNQKEEVATCGFAPDAEFPLTYAEKGLWQFHLVGPGSAAFTVDTGSALNVVPDKAIYQGEQVEALATYLTKQEYAYQLNGNELIVLGQSIHAKDAPKGKNAVTRLAAGLASVFDHPLCRFLAEKVQQDATGQAIFGQVQDEASGGLTFNVANLQITPTSSKVGIDVRIPVTADKARLEQQLKEALIQYGLTYQEHDFLASLYVPLESELVQTLLSIYRQETGDMTDPFSSGGATFARTMPNCVAFGAVFEDDPVTFHQIDERISLTSLYRAMEIYAKAVKALATVEKGE